MTNPPPLPESEVQYAKRVANAAVNGSTKTALQAPTIVLMFPYGSVAAVIEADAVDCTDRPENSPEPGAVEHIRAWLQEQLQAAHEEGQHAANARAARGDLDAELAAAEERGRSEGRKQATEEAAATFRKVLNLPVGEPLPDITRRVRDLYLAERNGTLTEAAGKRIQADLANALEVPEGPSLPDLLRMVRNRRLEGYRAGWEAAVESARKRAEQLQQQAQGAASAAASAAAYLENDGPDEKGGF